MYNNRLRQAKGFTQNVRSNNFMAPKVVEGVFTNLKIHQKVKKGLVHFQPGFKQNVQFWPFGSEVINSFSASSVTGMTKSFLEQLQKLLGQPQGMVCYWMMLWCFYFKYGHFLLALFSFFITNTINNNTIKNNFVFCKIHHVSTL